MPDKKVDSFLKLQQELLESIPDSLKPIYERGLTRSLKTSFAKVTTAWLHGDDAKKTLEDEELGEAALQTLAVLWNLRQSFDAKKEANYLGELRDFATQFAMDWVKSQLQKAEAVGFELSLQHFLELKRIASPTEVEPMVDRVIAGRLSAKRLREEIFGAGLNKKSNKTKGGRPVLKPASVQAAVKQVNASCKSLLKRLEGWDEMYFQPFADHALQAEQITDDLLGQLTDSAEQLDKLAKELALRAKYAKSALKQATSLLEEAEEAPKAKKKVKATVAA